VVSTSFGTALDLSDLSRQARQAELAHETQSSPRARPTREASRSLSLSGSRVARGTSKQYVQLPERSEAGSPAGSSLTLRTVTAWATERSHKYKLNAESASECRQSLTITTSLTPSLDRNFRTSDSGDGSRSHVSSEKATATTTRTAAMPRTAPVTTSTTREARSTVRRMDRILTAKGERWMWGHAREM